MKILSKIKHSLIICTIAFALSLLSIHNLKAQSWGYNSVAVQSYQKNKMGMEKSTADMVFDGHVNRELDKDKSKSKSCPLIEELKAKYTKDCWVCPVLKQLTNSFVGAGTIALGLSQEAGVFLLKFGTILWILIWGLRHVSSMAQVEPANILSELLKFLFKVILAYAFIYGGVRAIATYFTNPIMGFGAKIAETFWETERIKPQTKEYIWADISEEDEAELEKNIEEERKRYEENNGQQGSGGQGGTSGEDGGYSQGAIDNDGSETNEVPPAVGPIATTPYKGTVPSFIIPPVYSGSITSPAGCRFHPVYKRWKRHDGLDIGGNNGIAIVASADGTITYKFNSGDTTCKQGYGCYAIITHAGGWSSVYAHMPCEICHNPPVSGKVKKGEAIGRVGSTGTSTGPHLHFEVKESGRAVEPLHLLVGEILYIDKTCNAEVGATPFPYGMWPNISASAVLGSANSKEFVIVNQRTASNGGSQNDYNSQGSNKNAQTDYDKYTQTTYAIRDYAGSSVILSDAIVESMLGAAKAIGNIMAENMILGEAIMCFATHKDGGAMQIKVLEKTRAVFTNPVMWLDGAFIWVTGLLLTMAYAFYLVDIAFKIGFAIIALPIAAGLWPFEMTKDKLGICISIIAKAAATFAFLAITTSYTVYMTEATFNYEEIENNESADGVKDGGLSRLYTIFDNTTEGNATTADIEYASGKLEIFSVTFILILFSFLYSFKLVRKTVPDLVNKFFQDKAFGDSSPMHQWSTATAKAIKDVAMKPVGYARDIALYQGGKLAQKGASAVGNVAAKGVQGAGKGAQAVGKGIETAGKGINAAGKGIDSAGKSLQAIPYVGAVVGGAVSAVGTAVQAAGKTAEITGKGVNAAGKAVEKTGKAAEKVNKAANKIRDKKEDKSEKKKDEGDK